jgi:hypothetical protein
MPLSGIMSRLENLGIGVYQPISKFSIDNNDNSDMEEGYQKHFL